MVYIILPVNILKELRNRIFLTFTEAILFSPETDIFFTRNKIQICIFLHEKFVILLQIVPKCSFWKVRLFIILLHLLGQYFFFYKKWQHYFVFLKKKCICNPPPHPNLKIKWSFPYYCNKENIISLDFSNKTTFHSLHKNVQFCVVLEISAISTDNFDML